MPAVSPTALIESVLDAVRASGGSAVYLSDSVRTHPRRFGVQYLNKSFLLWIYIWTLTHGGGAARPKDEYRIQMTTVEPPLALNPNGSTLLLGYYPDLNLFAGYDIQEHLQFTLGSPSVQIGLVALHDALQNGLSFYERANEEIAVGVRPDQFLMYALHADRIHREGPSVRSLLERAARLEGVGDVEAEAAEMVPERERIVTEVARMSRDASFRRRVLDAYGHRCAVTRAQLELVDAAHILPVVVEGSTDTTTNGLALSPTMHRAFDHALIYLDRDHIVRLNEERADELRSLNRADGLSSFQQLLDAKIHLPADPSLHPDVAFISAANKHRRIPGVW